MRETPFGPIDVVDAHTHFFSHRFFDMLAGQVPELGEAPDRVARVGEITGWTMPPEAPEKLAAAWVEELDRHDVSAALMIASAPRDEESIGVAVAAAPERIVGAFMIDPTAEDVYERVQPAFDDHGLRVPCLFPAMNHYSVAESTGARSVVALANERPGTAVFVHFGALSVGVRQKIGLPSRFDLRYSNPLDLHPLASEFPNVNFIVPHFGAGMFREALMVADLCPNVYLDTSSSNKWMAYYPALTDLATVFRQALAVVGHERLLFGTDSSFFPRGWHAAIFDAQVAALGEVGVTPEQAAAILGGNLRRLLALS